MDYTKFIKYDYNKLPPKEHSSKYYLLSNEQRKLVHWIPSPSKICYGTQNQTPLVYLNQKPITLPVCNNIKEGIYKKEKIIIKTPFYTSLGDSEENDLVTKLKNTFLIDKLKNIELISLVVSKGGEKWTSEKEQAYIMVFLPSIYQGGNIKCEERFSFSQSINEPLTTKWISFTDTLEIEPVSSGVISYLVYQTSKYTLKKEFQNQKYSYSILHNAIERGRIGFLMKNTNFRKNPSFGKDLNIVSSLKNKYPYHRLHSITVNIQMTQYFGNFYYVVKDAFTKEVLIELCEDKGGSTGYYVGDIQIWDLFNLELSPSFAFVKFEMNNVGYKGEEGIFLNFYTQMLIVEPSKRVWNFSKMHDSFFYFQ